MRRHKVNQIGFVNAFQLCGAASQSVFENCLQGGELPALPGGMGRADYGANQGEYILIGLKIYTARRLNLQCNPTADRQPGTFPEASM